MIAAIGMARNEGDLIELWLRHNLAEGIDHIWLAENRSTDHTREIAKSVAAETGQITVIDNDDDMFFQVAWMNRLLHMAGEAGATWVCPLDVDEFLVSTNGETVADTLSGSADRALAATMFRHHSWDLCETIPKPLPKVVVRYDPNAALAIGNHSSNVGVTGVGMLEIREWQYRSYEHFVAKARLSSATIPPNVRAEGGAYHHTRLDGKTDEDMWQEWQTLMARETRLSPIPSHLNTGSLLLGVGQ